MLTNKFDQRVPYDWKNPIGYLAVEIYQYIALQRWFVFLGKFAMLAIGGLLFGITFVRDMKTVLKSTNDSAIIDKQNKLQALKKFQEFVEIHAIVKELSVIHITTCK